ncbi:MULTISPECIES: hypothetical protein [unclassified Aeromicrobium]|uniref:hypothetical protein n=1 Tax=unclassified Aeromicrobium TaxID=2633570 RepID=UPI000ACDD2CD|nr:MULTISPECIES: hypothetical protein [unclassified Aeromicrobium]MCR4514575.1 hypothetical protein [Aeromicrobium sp. 50.2.37]
MAIRGKLREHRVDEMLADPEKYFAAVRDENRKAIKREDVARRKRRRVRLA